MNPIEKFQRDVQDNINSLGEDIAVSKVAREFMIASARHKYTYNFSWMGRPIIQFPQDMAAMQELVWAVKPDLIIETGIAHGGSLVFSASMLALLDMVDSIETGIPFDPGATKRKVVGIDIDIRSHNRAAINAHPMSSRIEMIQGSSTSPDVIENVKRIASRYERVLVSLDSNHTHEHVLAELEAYAQLVSVDSYCVVFDTAIEDVPKEMFRDRSWGPGNSPKTAVWEYLKTHPQFEIDKDIPNKLLITVAPDGYLRRVR